MRFFQQHGLQQRLDGLHILGRVGDPLQRFANHIVLCDGGPEQQAGDAGHRLVAVGLRTRGGHGGRGANAHQLICLEPFAQSAHQQRHIGTLTATVRVQLIQHQKFKPLAVLHHLAVNLFKAREDQLQAS
jgi:hypothetical protein